MRWDVLLPALAVPAALAVSGVMGHWAARARRPGGECGDFWARMTGRICVCLGLPALLSGWSQTILGSVWDRGFHLHFDVVPNPPLPGGLEVSFLVALAIPLLVWVALLAYGVAEKPGDREAGRWLAGGAGFSPSRRWILGGAVPLLACLAIGGRDLGGGVDAYPGALWSTLAAVVAGLIGVAMSAGTKAAPAAAASAEPVVAPRVDLVPWPEALRAAGVETTPITSWRSSPQPRRGLSSSLAVLGERLTARGARGVAPEVVEAVHSVLEDAADGRERSCLLVGPDDCGQVEAVALGAELLAARAGEVTLVVTPRDAGLVAAALNRWLPEARRAASVGAAGDLSGQAGVWVVDAATLSERFLRRFRDESLVARIGLVVWWHLHEYTGVLAANMWAVSRRLDRLLRKLGRDDVRTLALIRDASAPETQLARFVRRLLPHEFRREIRVLHHQPRDVHLHMLAGHRAYFSDGRGRQLPEPGRHPVVVAALASVAARWPTYAKRPADVTDVEWGMFERAEAAGRAVHEALADSPPAAGARLRVVGAADVLALPEVVGQGGRATPDGGQHHVGIMAPQNPYVAHLVSKLGGSEGVGYRRLVCAEGHESIVERHLLLALSEHEDTDSGLRDAALWNEEVLRRTLESLSHRRLLRSREVRSLGPDGRLKLDRVYKSLQGAAEDIRPLDTAGNDPIPVREVAGGKVDQGIRMMVDAERLGIKAYPGRIFMHRGRRYAVREWDSVDEARRRGRVECELTDTYQLSWRERIPSVYKIEPEGSPRRFDRGGAAIVRQVANVIYEEEVRGTVLMTPNLTAGSASTRRVRFRPPIRSRFATKALLLEIADAHDDVSLHSIAQALRHALPVHVGVDDDALEVVPVRDRGRTGLAVVDLFPGGIGVVEAIHEDDALVLDVLLRVHGWLLGCACGKEDGCASCLRSPEALASDVDGILRRKAALDVLQGVVAEAREG